MGVWVCVCLAVYLKVKLVAHKQFCFSLSTGTGAALPFQSNKAMANGWWSDQSFVPAVPSQLFHLGVFTYSATEGAGYMERCFPGTKSFQGNQFHCRPAKTPHG